MITIILAAGYATRLSPLTDNFPKPLLKVKEKTILDWLVDDIQSTNAVSKFVVVSNHKFVEHFNKWAETKKENIKILDDGSMTNETRIGAVKDISFAIKQESINEDILVVAGDNVLDFSLKTFIDFYNQKQTSCIMKYYEPIIKEGKRYCITQTDERDKVLFMKEKVLNPPSNWITPAFYIYKKQDLHLIEQALADNCPYDAPGSLVEWMCQRTPFHAMTMPGKRYDIGTIESYEKVNKGFRE